MGTLKPFECQGHVYTSFNGHLCGHKCFFTNNQGHIYMSVGCSYYEYLVTACYIRTYIYALGCCCQNSMAFLWFQGVLSCRIKPPPKKKNFLFSFPGRAPLIFRWISEGLFNSPFTEEIFNSKNRKNVPHSLFFFFNFMNPLIINFWKFHDHPKACLEVIRLPSWPKIVKFSVKMQFFMFLTAEKPVFELMTNLEFSFLKVELEVFTFPRPIFLSKFSNF